MDMQNYHVLIGSIYGRNGQTFGTHDRLLPQKSPRDRL